MKSLTRMIISAANATPFSFNSWDPIQLNWISTGNRYLCVKCELYARVFFFFFFSFYCSLWHLMGRGGGGVSAIAGQFKPFAQCFLTSSFLRCSLILCLLFIHFMNFVASFESK